MNRMIPVSLFSQVIPEIIRTPNDFYMELDTNTRVIERQHLGGPDHCRPITNGNWKRFLSVGTHVKIPLSLISMHHKQIEEYGHDRVLELIFLRSNDMANGDTQMTFCTMEGTKIHARWEYVACRASTLKDHSYRIYAMMSDDEIRRDWLRYKLLKWRRALVQTETDILDSEERDGNISKSHADYIRVKVRALIASTYHEHIERRMAFEKLMGIKNHNLS